MTDMQQIQVVEKLSLQQQYRLIEIAHETTDHEIKKAALETLRQYLNPLMMCGPGQSTIEPKA